jgi:hypothetical protein
VVAVELTLRGEADTDTVSTSSRTLLEESVREVTAPAGLEWVGCEDTDGGGVLVTFTAAADCGASAEDVDAAVRLLGGLEPVAASRRVPLPSPRTTHDRGGGGHEGEVASPTLGALKSRLAPPAAEDAELAAAAAFVHSFDVELPPPGADTSDVAFGEEGEKGEDDEQRDKMLTTTSAAVSTTGAGGGGAGLLRQFVTVHAAVQYAITRRHAV